MVVILYGCICPATTPERETAGNGLMAELAGAVRRHDPDRGDMPVAALLAAERPFASASTRPKYQTPLSVVTREISSHEYIVTLTYVWHARLVPLYGPIDVYVPAVGELPVAEEAPLQERAARRRRRRWCTGRGGAAKGSGGALDDVALRGVGGEEGGGFACDLSCCWWAQLVLLPLLRRRRLQEQA